MAAAPIYSELREKAAAKRHAYNRKIFREACNDLAAFMDTKGFAELFKSENSEETNESWIRIWNTLNPERTAETIEFKVKGVTYWLTRDI